MTTVINKFLLDIKASKTSSFDKKPTRGGIPEKEKNTKTIIKDKTMFF